MNKLPGIFLLSLLIHPIFASPEIKEYAVYFYSVGDDLTPGKKSNSSEFFKWRQFNGIEQNIDLSTTWMTLQFDQGFSKKKGRNIDPNATDAIRMVPQFGKGGIKMTEMENLGEVNTGNPNEYYRFLKWSFRNYPAKRVFLVINSHGSGILSWSGPTSSLDGGSYNDVVLDPFTAYDGTGDSMTIFEYRKVLSRMKHRFPTFNPELAFFGNCLNGMIEVANELKNHLDYMVASPALSYTVYTWEDFFQRLHKPGVPTSILADLIIYDYQKNAAPYNLKDLTMTSYDLKKTDQFNQAVEKFLNLARPQITDKVRKNILNHYVERYFSGKYYADHIQVLQLIRSEIVRATQKDNLYAALATVVQASKYLMPKQFKTGKYARSNGVSVFWPNPGERTTKSFMRFYQKLDYAKDFSWDDLLQELIYPQRSQFHQLHE